MPAQDNFNRANGPLGANWTNHVSSPDTNVILSNAVTANSDNNICNSYWNANTFSNDQSSQVTIVADTGAAFVAACVRMDGVSDRFYMGLAIGTDARIYTRWDGSYNLAHTSTGIPWAPGDILKTEVLGSVSPITVNVYRNGSLVCTLDFTSDLKTGGAPGFSVYRPTGESAGIDDWQGAPAAFSLSAATGLFSLTGYDAGLNWTHVRPPHAIDAGRPRRGKRELEVPEPFTPNVVEQLIAERDDLKTIIRALMEIV